MLRGLRLQVVRSVIIGYAAAVAAQTSYAFECTSAFGKLSSHFVTGVLLPVDVWFNTWGRLRLPKEAKDFDLAAFHAYRAGFASPERIEEFGRRLAKTHESPGIEQWMAFLEASASRGAVTDPLNVRSVVAGGSPAARKTLFIEGLNARKRASENGLRPAELDELIAEIYASSHGAPDTLRALVPDQAGRSALSRRITERIELEIATRSASEIFEQTGLGRNPGAKERFFSALKKREVTLDWAATALFNLPSAVLGMPPLYLPRGTGLLKREVPESIREKILTQGLDSAYPDLLAMHQQALGSSSFNRAEFELRYQWFRRIYMAISTTSIAYVGLEVALEKYSEYRKTQAELDRVSEGVRAVQEAASPSPKQVMDQVLERYHDGYKEKYGEQKLEEHLRSEEYRTIRQILLGAPPS